MPLSSALSQQHRPFGHTSGQFRNHDRRRQVHVANDLFTLDRAAHRLLTGDALACASSAPWNADAPAPPQRWFTVSLPERRLVICHGLCWLSSRFALVLARRSGGAALFGVHACRLRCAAALQPLAAFALRACASSSSAFALQAFFALAIFRFFGFDLGTTRSRSSARAFSSALALALLRLARLGSLNAFRRRSISTSVMPAGRLEGSPNGQAPAPWLLATRLGHHNALAFGLDHDVLGTPVAKALLYVAGTRAARRPNVFLPSVSLI